MDITLKFKLTLLSGEVTEQEIQIPADPNHPIDKQTRALMQTMMTQYAQVGMLRQPSPGMFMLLCPSQIALVECELPSIVLASANEVPKITLE